MVDEPDDFKSFRLGLFGIDKLQNIDRTVKTLAQVLEKLTD
jgi:aspartate aminotransferase-like enzyme